MKLLRSFAPSILALVLIISATTGLTAYQSDNAEVASLCTKISIASTAGLIAMSSVGLAFGFLGSPGLEALKRNSHRFGSETKADWAKDNIVAYDDTLYIRKAITGASGIHKLADNASAYAKESGVRNVDKNKLPEGYNFAIEAIWLAEGNHASQTDPKNISNYTNVMSSVQVELRHAEFVITQDSKEILRLPVSSMLAPAASTTATKKDIAFHLKDNCPVLVEGRPFEINIEFPAALGTFSTSTNKFHIEVELFGKATRKKTV
jgi:hypothetical protein